VTELIPLKYRQYSLPTPLLFYTVHLCLRKTEQAKSIKLRLNRLEPMRRTEPEISWRYCDRIEEGVYPAFCRSACLYFDRQFKRWVCAVQFDILSDSLVDVVARLTWYLNLGSRIKPQAGRRTNYWKAWVIANGGPPKRTDRLSCRIFVRRHARVVVADTQRDFEQATTPVTVYSVVRSVIEWETGRRK
jgi:hypothetical protein